MVTIRDIARESGYAVSTVSRVMSNHPDVSAQAKSKVLEVVKKYRFVPNSNAKQLKQQDSNTISIIVKGTNNMLFAPIVEQMQIKIEKAYYMVAVDYLDEDADEVEDALRICREGKPLGLLLLGGSMNYFKAGFDGVTVPSVLVTTPAEEMGFGNLSSVYTDDKAGAGCAMDYLFEHGHRNIGVVGGNFEISYTSYLRYQGCVESFQKRGLTFNKEHQYEPGRYSFSSAYSAMNRLKEKMPELTAVFCMSDVMAAGAIRALRDQKLIVPEDVSVIGYDGIELAEYYNPKITTIQQKMKKLAVRSVEILIDSIENNTPAVHEVVPFELLAGESVKNLEQEGEKR